MSTESPGQDHTDQMLLWFRYYTDESNRVTFLNGVQSAMVAYGDITYDRANQNSVYNKKAMRPLISLWLDEVGLSEDYLKSRVRQLSQAKEIKHIKVKGRIEQKDLPVGHTVICHADVKKLVNGGGSYIETETLIAVELEDTGLQRQCVDMGFKLKGSYAADTIEVFGLGDLTTRLTKANQRIRGGDDSSSESVFD